MSGRSRSAESYEREIASLTSALQAECANSLRLARGADPDYSPTYQDEYQRLWHEARRELAATTEALAGLDEPWSWIAEHYPKAMREMPRDLYGRLAVARAALTPEEPTS